jgi:hypothetical protein
LKTLEKTRINKLPKANIIVDNDKYAFLDGIEMFVEKNTRAKEALKNIHFPPR